jgi:signal transduction histidine kinase
MPLPDLLNDLQHGAGVFDAQLRCTGLNAHAERLLGITGAQLLGRTLCDALPAPHADQDERHLRDALAQRGHCRFDSVLHGLEVEADPLSNGGLLVQWRPASSQRSVRPAADEFLGMLAHELRNPLAPLQTALELLNRPLVAPETKERARQIMGRQITRLTRLIEEVVDISRAGNGKLSIEPAPWALAALVDAAVDTTRAALADRQQALSLQLPPTPAWLSVDRSLVVRALSNLLGHASRAGSGGMPIRLRADVASNGVTIAVRDEGLGDASAPHDPFQLFAEATAGDAALPGGLDVGLTLARRLAELHGGSLLVRQEARGQGSEFALRLPPSVLCEPPDAATDKLLAHRL